MHYTCVAPSEQGGDQQCPICRTEVRVEKEEGDSELPLWHEVEVGAPRKKARPYPEVGKPPFPATRWPVTEEARLYGYETLKDWYIDYRRSTEAQPQDKEADYRRFAAEFQELENRKSKSAEEKDEVTLVREAQVCTRRAEAVLAVLEPRSSLGTAETGRSLTAPLGFADVEPLAW